MNNNIEIESKILDVSHMDLEKKLFELGARKIFEWELKAIWLVNINWKKVRVRQEWDKVMIEYKEDVWTDSSIKQMKEIWFEADSFDKVLEVFELLWFEKLHKSIKKRVSYWLVNHEEFWNIQFDFDNYSDLEWRDDIPEFMEIEASSKDIIIKVANILWFKESDCKSFWPKELLEYY